MFNQVVILSSVRNYVMIIRKLIIITFPLLMTGAEVYKQKTLPDKAQFWIHSTDLTVVSCPHMT